MNELGDEMPQVWDVPPYSRYYLNEDRRKRSEKSGNAGSTTVKPSTTSFQSSASTHQTVQAQVKRRWAINQLKKDINSSRSGWHSLSREWSYFTYPLQRSLKFAQAVNVAHGTVLSGGFHCRVNTVHAVEPGCVRANSPVEQAGWIDSVARP